MKQTHPHPPTSPSTPPPNPADNRRISSIGTFVFVAFAGVMIYAMYMDHKCRRTPGCKPDPNLPTTNAVDSFGDKILTAWNTGPIEQ